MNTKYVDQLLHDNVQLCNDWLKALLCCLSKPFTRIQRWRKIGVLLLTMLQHAQRTLAHIAIGRFASMIGAQRLLSNDQRKDEGLPPVHAPSTPPTPPEALAKGKAKGKGKGKGKGADSSSEEEEAGAIAKGKAKGKEK